MRDFFLSGQVLDVVIALTLLEFAALAIYHAKTKHGLSPAALAGPLASGISLVLAFRLHTLAIGWPWIALCLLASLVFHLIDLNRRWL